MSQVNGQDNRLINTEEDVLALYSGAGEENVRFGMELELCFFDRKTLQPLSKAQNNELRRGTGFEVHQEPGPDVLEVTTKARSFDGGFETLQELTGKAEALTARAQELGLGRCFFEFLPHVPTEDLLDNIVDKPRYQAFFVPVRSEMADIAAYFVTSKSTQVSVSYRDPDHLLENLRRLYFLAPFLFMLTDNNPGYMYGAPDRVKFHPGMTLRAALRNRGGVPSYLFTEATGEAYLRAHISHVMNGPMFVYYDRDGNYQQMPKGKVTSFLALKESGLNTAANFFLSESILWPDVKIAALQDDQGSVTGHRYEARMFGSGIHQPATALSIVSGLASDPAFAQGTERLLKEFGFYCDQPAGSRKILEESYQAARLHGGRYFDIPYGLGRMRDFAARFGDLLEETCAGTPMAAAIYPALHICRTGRTDAYATSEYLPKLEDVLSFLRNHNDIDTFDRNSCADSIFSRLVAEPKDENRQLTGRRAALE